MKPQRQNLPLLSQRAVELHRLGDLSGANRLYLEILEAEPGDFPARHMLGLVRHQQGQNDEALTLIDAALQINPGVAEAWSNYGLVLLALDRLPDALDAFARAIELKPGYAEAFNNRAIALSRAGRYQEAVEECDRALAARPIYPEALNNRGNALRGLGKSDEALQSYDRALALNPAMADARGNREGLKPGEARRAENPDALNNYGGSLRRQRRFEEALDCFNRVLAIKPDHVPALINHGVAMWDLKRYEDAIVSYDKALALEPGHVEALNNRGVAHWHLKRPQMALESFDAALKIRPDYAQAMHNRGLALGEMRRFEEAIGAYEEAGRLDPRHKFTVEAVAHASLHLCDWKRTARAARDLKTHVFEKKTIIHPFILLGYSDDPALLLEGARTFIRDRIPEPPQPLWDGRPYGHDKIRIAYLSADFRKHATAYLVAELMERHDRDRFEVMGFSFGHNDASAMRARLEKAFDRFHDVKTVGDLEVARLMREMEVDIAVDLKGYTTDQRPEIFAWRPAPVQVNYLGFPGSLGTDFMDYVIGDPVVTPFAHAPFYSEKIVQLADCYQVNDSTRAIAEVTPSRAEAGLPEKGFVFCCFNDNYKLTPPIFDIWMRLLKAVPGSVLWLIMANPGTMDYLRREAGARGVDPDRLVFAPKQELPHHLARHRLADLFLDTLPYNAHTTTSDALWAGLPVLTCLGQSFAGRVAASLLKAMGLPELITETLDDYEALALQLAREPERLAAFRARLAQTRLAAPLFDTERFRRQIEAAYVYMWERAEAGLPPEPFGVASEDAS